MNLISEYRRARESFAWCLEEHPSPDADWLRLLGTADNYCEMLWLEEEMLIALEGLS